ncbi:MAG: hypothetical protein QMC37_04540, partial [Flavobacteriales bacterium]
TITTVPSIAIALLVFLIVGFTGVSESKDLVYNEIFSEVISSKFNIHLGLFIAPVIVLIMIAKKVPAAAALFIGVLLGGLSAIIFQPQAVQELAGDELILFRFEFGTNRRIKKRRIQTSKKGETKGFRNFKSIWQ